jgi:hypothetical protein
LISRFDIALQRQSFLPSPCRARVPFPCRAGFALKVFNQSEMFEDALNRHSTSGKDFDFEDKATL